MLLLIVSLLLLLLIVSLFQVATLEEKCREMMMLKFGRVVDLEQLENVTVNKLAEELQRKIKQQEKSANKELTQIKVSHPINSNIICSVNVYRIKLSKQEMN